MISSLRQKVAGAIIDSFHSASSPLRPGPNFSQDNLASLVRIVRLGTAGKAKRNEPANLAQLSIDADRLLETKVLLEEEGSSSSPGVELRRLVSANLDAFVSEGVELASGDPLGDEDSSLLFRYDKHLLVANVIDDILSPKNRYGHFSALHARRYADEVFKPAIPERIVFEYSSPNIAKPFHVGHLRSTILGNCLSKLNSFLGDEVTRINYLGDWGTQFGLLAVGAEPLGDVEAAIAASDRPLADLLDVYVRINAEAERDENVKRRALAFFSRMENGEEEALRLWAALRSLSLAELKRVYEKLGVEFDVVVGESDYGRRSSEFLRELKRKYNFVRVSDKEGMEGTLIVEFASGRQPAPIAKSDGSSLYLTRDLMAAEERLSSLQFHKMFYLVGDAQKFHFENLTETLKLMHPEWKEKGSPIIQHLPFGHVIGLSTRKGNVVSLDELLEEAFKRVRESLDSSPNTKVENRDEVSERLAVGAIIVQDLEKRRTANYKFDWKAALNFKTHSGVTLQYAHARLCSLQRNFGSPAMDGRDAAHNLVANDEAVRLAQGLAAFDDILKQSRDEHEPAVLVHYLYEIMHLSNKAWRTMPVKAFVNTDLGTSRLVLFRCAKHVLAQGMELLGLTPLEKM